MAVMLAEGISSANEMAITPEPVPMSIIDHFCCEGFSEHHAIVLLTKNSVSKRGIRARESVKNVRPKNSTVPFWY